MKTFILVISLAFSINMIWASENITAHKFNDYDSIPVYQIPPSSRFTAKRADQNAPDIGYYFTKPKTNAYPIAILCGGSTSQDCVRSIIHFHRYFLKELLDLNCASLTVEQWGVDGDQIDEGEFIQNYTRSQRLKDHQTVIDYIKKNPPIGWNGKFVFLGVSEGGPIVTSLSAKNSNMTLATIIWSGAGDWNWRDELWVFCQNLITQNPECPHNVKLADCRSCLEAIGSRQSFDQHMDMIANDSTHNSFFLGMTYKYHADALSYPPPSYQELASPLLVVSGAKDTIIQSSDAFVRKANEAHANVTYLRIPNMDHYVRKRPDIINQSFDWLNQKIH